MKLLQGNPIVKKIDQNDIVPNLDSTMLNLAIILIGKNPDSLKFVNEKQKAGKDLGMEVSIYKFEDSGPLEEIEDTIEFLNKDEDIEGILIQLPLPEKIKSETNSLIDLIDPAKDVDVLGQSRDTKFCVSTSNDNFPKKFAQLKKHYLEEKIFLPPTACAVMEIIDHYQIEPKDILIIGQGLLVGRPIAALFDQMKIEYQAIDECCKEKDRKNKLQKADLIISGTSSSEPIFGPNDIKNTATVIDCAGDFNHNECNDKLEITSTPAVGGVGPVTIRCLLRNLIYSKLWLREAQK